jgi:excisionase family DNA binding protein
MAKDSTRPAKYVDRPDDTLTQLKTALRRRGLSDGEIAATLRKKKRRKPLEFGVVKSKHLLPMTGRRKAQDKVHHPEPKPRLADELCTVEFAADRLKVHQKTILRFVRKGRLKATRIGKSYRILRSDLEAFAGVALPAAAPAQASVTSIVDVPDVAPDLAKRLSLAITSALNPRAGRAAPMRADVIYEPERAHLKIVVTGAPGDTVNLLGLIRMWIEH